jgi:hypothetical protein
VSGESPLEPGERLREAVIGDLAPLAHRRLQALALITVVAVVPVVLLYAAGGNFRDWIALGALLAGGLGLMALALGVRLPPRRWLHPLVAVGAVGAWALLWSFVTPGSPRGAASPFDGAHCLGIGAGLSALTAVAAWLLGRGVLRRRAPTGLLVGVGAGLVGLVQLQILCVADAAAHVLVWHAAVPLVTGALAGVAWGLLGEGY